MGKSIAEISEALFTDGNPQVQESEFKHVWLPLIAGLSGPAPIERWMHIAGSPFAEVDVFNGNEFLFTVPPVPSNRRAIDPNFQELPFIRLRPILLLSPDKAGSGAAKSNDQRLLLSAAVSGTSPQCLPPTC